MASFFQAGKTIYTVTADQGEVQQNGETLFLQGHLVAKSLENKLTLESERLRWQPKQDLLVMGNFKDDKFTEAVPSDTPSADAGNGDANSAPATPTEPLSDPLSMDEINRSQALLGAQSAETASDLTVRHLLRLLILAMRDRSFLLIARNRPRSLGLRLL